MGANGEVVTREREGKVWELIALLALNSVLTVERLLRTDLLVQKLGEGAGECNERSTGVQNGTGRVNLSSLVAKGDGIKVDLPVGFPAERDLGHLSGVVLLVNSTEDSLRLVTVVGVAQVESKHRLVEQTLVNHVVKRRGDAVHRDGVIAKPHDAVKTAEGEGKTRFRGCLSEELVLDLQITNLDGVLADISLKLARAVANLKLRAVLLVRTRITVVVLAVQVTSDRAAVLARHPQVGAAGVQYNLELLRRRTDLDLGEVLGVQEVADSDRVALLRLEGLLLEHLFHITLGPDAHVLLAQGLHVVADVSVFELLRQRDFLQTAVALACSLDDAAAPLLVGSWRYARHLVDTSRGRAGQCGGNSCRSLHVDVSDVASDGMMANR